MVSDGLQEFESIYLVGSVCLAGRGLLIAVRNHRGRGALGLGRE